MKPRSLLLPLLLFLSVPATAQLARSEVSVSLGRWDSDQIGNAPALGASYNRFWTQMFSTRVGALGVRDGDFTTGIVHASAELHLFRASRVSPWVGAGGAWATTRRAASNDHFAGSDGALTGINSGGVDVSVSPRFAIGGEVSSMNYELGLGNRFGYTIDPVTVMLTGRMRY